MVKLTGTPGPCDLARAGNPLDVTQPDDSRVSPGETFIKTWRLENIGTCAWSQNYRVVWYSGDPLGLTSEQELGEAVEPGQTVDISVDMVAPDDPGVYASYWMLRNSSGDYFGLGPAGTSPFWARIQVVAGNKATPQPNLTPVTAAIVERSGTVPLALGDTIDLDSGNLTVSDSGDFVYQQDETDQLLFTPENNAGLGVFGPI